MNTAIYDPLEEYEQRLKALHTANTEKYLDELVKRSGVDVLQNRETVRLYNECTSNSAKLRKKLNWLRFLRVLMIITLVLIPLVILKTTPKIRELRTEIAEVSQKASEFLNEAQRQMQPLNSLFTDRDALNLVESALPLLRFEDQFSVKQEADMIINYDFCEYDSDQQSTIDILAGHYNENPFLFENKLIHTMGVETYHGYRTIHWTETYRDSDGRFRTRTRSQTLHASVTKPKPFYNTRVVLNYCAQGGPELSFTRDATNLDEKSDREIERYVKKGEKKLKKMTDKAIKENGNFTSMSNSDFEVLFDALDRTNEVQFRTLFTPLAQTNMVSLIRSKVGYGDDFNFVKAKRTNRIVSEHSQGRAINLYARDYYSYSFDIIKQKFVGKNEEFFKAVYFDFAPLLAIPIYQERPVHSLKPIPEYEQQYSIKDCEALANAVDCAFVVHPETKTRAILKSTYGGNAGNADKTLVTAYSYDIEKRVDIIPVWGGDGRYHNVPVEWDDYIPLENSTELFVTRQDFAEGKSVLASRNGLCIFN